VKPDNNRSIPVLIVDDIVAVRRDLSTALTLAADVEIVGEAANGLEAVRLAGSLEPAVVLMDLEMPVMDGYEAARRIKLNSPACRIIALTVHGYDSARYKAMQAGVDEFVVKGAPLESLLAAISRPGFWMGPKE
jgi:DNA-binding NarL/FixJ family response regulator